MNWNGINNIHQFVYYGDSHLYPSRWESVVDDRDNIDLIELLTWNDYGESHYIAPVKGDQPNSQAWVDGFAHDGTSKPSHEDHQVGRER